MLEAMRTRVLFVNAGILGHRSVAQLIREAVQCGEQLEAHHLDLSEGLTIRDRVIRRLTCFQLFGSARFRGSNLDFARWRQEYHCGMLAERRIRQLEKLGRSFDVLHFHTQACAYASLGRMRRTPTIVSIDATQGLASLEAPSKIQRWTYRPNIVHDGWVFRSAHSIIATSQWAADDLIATYPDCVEKVNVMPYPVKLECFEPAWIDDRYNRFDGGKQGFISRSEMATDLPVRFLFIGGDFVRKGGPELLAAWRQGDFCPQARLELITSYDLSETELPAGVTVTAGVSAYTPPWYDAWRRADVFVMPTRGEVFGMVYQEAAAAGLPSIGSQLNAIPEIVKDGTTGLLIEPGNVVELIGAMKTLLQSANLRRQMGLAAREKMERQAQPADYRRRLCQLIHEASGNVQQVALAY